MVNDINPRKVLADESSLQESPMVTHEDDVRAKESQIFRRKYVKGFLLRLIALISLIAAIHLHGCFCTTVTFVCLAAAYISVFAVVLSKGSLFPMLVFCTMSLVLVMIVTDADDVYPYFLIVFPLIGVIHEIFELIGLFLKGGETNMTANHWLN